MTNNRFVSYLIFRKRAFLLILFYMLLLLFFLISSVYYFKIRIVQFILIISFLLPLIFIKQVLNYFTYKSTFTFNESSFEEGVQDNSIGKNNENIVQYVDIDSFKILFPNRRFVDIYFNLKNKQSIHYSFYKEANNLNGIDTNEIIDVFNNKIISYNQSVQNSLDKIKFLPSFYASTKGLYTILGLVILIVVAVFLHFLYSAKTLPVSLFLGTGILIQLIIRRQNDVQYYKKMKSMID